MGWTVKTKTEKGITKYKIWTTISDGWITEKWLTKDEITKFFFWKRLRDFRDKLLEDAMTFPNDYYDKDTGKRIFDEKISDDYREFAYKNSNKEEVLFDKLSEILNANGLSVTIKDERGYEYTSLKEQEN